MVIKGIAVLLMVFHHCFGFPDRYVVSPDFHVYLVQTALWAKICVPVFAFLSGWTYCHHRDKSVGYSIKKIVLFLADYWMVVLALSLFACVYCGYHYSVQTVWEFLPIYTCQLMIHAWYVSFYVAMMLFLPLFGVFERYDLTMRSCAVFFALLGVIMLVLHYVPWLSCLWMWFPCAVSGYFVARFRILEWCLSHMKTRASGYCWAILLLMVPYCLYGIKPMLFTQNTGYAAAPFFVLGLLLLMSAHQVGRGQRVLYFIGKHSMNVWFAHCIFHSPVMRKFIQPLFFFCNNPVWIFSVVLLFSLCLSILFTPIQHFINNRIINPLFAKFGL